MKRGVSVLFSLIFMSGFVSAFGHYRYGNIIDESLLVYGLVFIILFALINFALGRTAFRESPSSRAVISLATSALATYGLIKAGLGNNISGFSFGGYYLSEIIFPLTMVLAAIIILYLLFKYGLGGLLLFFGILALGICFFDLAYERRVVCIIGWILLGLGLLFLLWRRRRQSGGGGWFNFAPRIRLAPRFRFGGGGGGRNPPPNSPPEVTAQYKKRQRSIYDLKQKYRGYLFEYNSARRNPQRQKRIKQAMNVIIKKAGKIGYSKRSFLGSWKAPEDLK